MRIATTLLALVVFLSLSMIPFAQTSAQIIIHDVVWNLAFLPGNQGRAFGIDQSGSFPHYISGESENDLGVWRPSVWSHSGVGGWVLEFLPGIEVGKGGRAYNVIKDLGSASDHVLACGFAYDGMDRIRPVIWDRVEETWTMTPLPTLSGGSGEALAFASASLPDTFFYLGGYSTVLLPPAVEPGSAAGSTMMTVHQAVFWANRPPPNNLKVLPDYGPDRESMANDLDYDAANDRLYATGFAENLSGVRMPQAWYSADGGFNWTRVELPLVPGGTAGLGSDAGCGNNRVYITGTCRVGGDDHAVAWESLDMGASWMARDLGVPAGFESAEGFTGTTADDLGADFWTGAAMDVQGMREASYWHDDMGNIVSGPLEALLDMPTAAHLSEARGMDPQLRIVGWGLAPVPPPLGAAVSAVADTDTVAFVLTPTGSTDAREIVPNAPTARLEAKPNPFNPNVEIEFSIERGGQAQVRVYDAAGRHVATLFEGAVEAGRIRGFVWDGRDSRGRLVPSGVYFLRLTGEGAEVTKKIVLVE